MLGKYRFSLIFPQLVFEKETSFKAWGQKNTAIYRLDWSFKETQCDHDKHVPLPAQYDQMLKEQRFALPPNYLRQIRTSSNDAVTGWNADYPFDTMVREICLEPAMAHARVAFRLMADCLYDDQANKWDRRPSTYLIFHLLMLKFWTNQTGAGLVHERAEITRLRSKLDFQHLTSETRLLINEFLQDMTTHWGSWRSSTVAEEDPTGPDLS
jgi:hypothetical protein